MRKRIRLFSLIVTLSLGVCVNAWGAPFAYITNRSSDSVSVIDTATNTVIGAPIPVGSSPVGVAVNLAGTRVYVSNATGSVSVIDTATNTVIDAPIAVGKTPWGVAVNPAGTRVYIANRDSNSVSVIDTATNTVIGAPIPVATEPFGVAVNPAGTRVYVASWSGNSVSVINTATNTVIGAPIPGGGGPYGVAVNPAGTRVYVANASGSVSVIDTATNTVIGAPIPVGSHPNGIAVNPAGTRVYVANAVSNNVSVIDTATNTVIGAPIPVGSNPIGVAVNPAGTQVYVANWGSDNVSVIDTATNAVIGAPIAVGARPYAFGQFIGPAISPGEGTIGTEITIPGSGFGTTKGKVLVGNVVLKILEWTDSLIGCQLTKAMSPGTYNVTIQPKAKGASPIILENGFTVEAPEIDSTEPTSGSIGEEITVTGFFFGTKKGKVTLDQKNCKVLTWTMDPTTGQSEIHFVVPKGLALGTHELKVTNGVGSDTVNFTVD